MADTNIVVSGLLWRGSPSRVLHAAQSGTIRLFSSLTLLAELEDVLRREKFARRLAEAGIASSAMADRFRSGVLLVTPAPIVPVVDADPDDDAVLACAVAAKAEAIVSGDPHLLALKQYQGIPILTASGLLARIGLK